MRGGYKSRNSGTWTEARYWSQVRSHLRNGFRYWEAIRLCKLAARRKYMGDNKQRKYSFLCNGCRKLFKSTEVAVDHIVEVGSLKCAGDLVGFLERLTVEDQSGYQCLCKACHARKTNEENKAQRE